MHWPIRKQTWRITSRKKKDEVGRLGDAKSTVEGKIESVDGEIADTNSTMAEMLETRNKDVEAFKQALKDDTDAVALLGQAIEAITAFYTNNKLPLELLQKEPEYSQDPDKAPDASFGDGSGRKSETTGIIAILSMLREDLEMEIKTAREAEAKAQGEYVSQNADLASTMKAQQATELSLDGEKADLNMKISDTEGEIDNHNDMKVSTNAARDKLKPSCAWVEEHFESRRDARKKEIEGLQEAKGILAGASTDEFIQQPEFLQRQK